MSTIKIGLAPNKAGFYDPKTNTYMTLENPIQEINIAHFKAEDLLGLCRGLYAKHPAIVLFKGEMPKEAIDLWKQKYESIISDKYKKRIDDVNAKAGKYDQQSGQQGNEIEMQQVKEEPDIQAQALAMDHGAELGEESQEDESKEEENHEEEPQKKRTRRSRK